MRKCVFGALILPFLWCVLGTSSGLAQDSGVVLNFDGPGNRRVRNYVVRGIQRDIELLPVRGAESAASGAGLDINTPEGRRAAATDTGASILIGGDVRGRGRRARLSLRAFDDRGVEIASSECSAAPGRTGRRAVAAASQELLTQARSNLSSRQAEETARESWEEEIVISEEEVEEAEDSERVSTGWPRVRAVLGVEARDRNASVSFEPSLGERGYEASFHAELHARVESFPLGRNDNASRGLYLEGEFAHSVSLATEEAESRDSVDSSAWRLMIQVGYVFPVASDAVRFGILAGFGVDSFRLGPNTILPSSTYTQLRIGSMASIRLVENSLRVRIDAAYRHSFGVGDLADAFGSDASAPGFDLGATLEARFGVFVLGARAGVTRYGLSFSGDATEPNAASANERSGKDRAFNLGIQLGVAFD